ncbi:hypothetical protein PVAND_016703 [Polypedilum vanderplanki]|uniref:Uncharacterized protein n=1 Tax=Polypedilum vanderplanki TaxID=319348 RepID=A0A9J6BFW4_POLVA|nr:hypothetical protein PVAND_016703 [Polypedilum vanderplanki]
MELKNCVGVLIIFLSILKCGFFQSNQIIYNAPCRRHDPHLNQCLTKAFINARKSFASGEWLDGIQMRPMDPFNLQNHTFGGDTFFKIITENMTVNGLSNYIVEKYNVNLKDLSADIVLFYPKFADTAIYSGNINLIGVNFRGSFRSYYRNTRVFLHFEAEKYIKEGREYLRLVDVTLSSNKIFHALRSSHQVHNIVIPIIYPYIERTYAEIIREEMNKMADLIPYDMLLPE